VVKRFSFFYVEQVANSLKTALQKEKDFTGYLRSMSNFPEKYHPKEEKDQGKKGRKRNECLCYSLNVNEEEGNHIKMRFDSQRSLNQ
jgi:hypothetical protein